MLATLVLTGALLFTSSNATEKISNKKFPPNFIFGVATSAYQVEGAWNESGKSESIWDHLTHRNPTVIADESNGDKACDSYHKLDEDITMLKHLGMNFYRFSISWSRIIPTGNISDGINVEGVKYYQRLLSRLREQNIDAMVTLVHFDPPYSIFKKFVLSNGNLTDAFVEYAWFAFSIFGKDVKYWITFNEPKDLCADFEDMYSIIEAGRLPYSCAHTVIKSHAIAYRLYEKNFKEQYGGKVSIILDSDWDEPASNSTDDIEAAERRLIFEVGWFAHPIIFGDYPELMKKRIRAHTIPLLPSRLPEFTDEEKRLIKGTADFIGLNHYTSGLISNHPNSDFFRNYEKDKEIALSYDPSWTPTSLSWLYVVPFGMRKILNWLHRTYNMPIIVTENGYVENGTLNDENRIQYIKNYLSNLLDAVYIDKVNVLGYCTWSLMDNFEWTSGYTQKFGLYYVNFSSPMRERIPKKSVDYYIKILKTRCLVDKCDNAYPE